ncbi:hypothetical protein D9758_015685 [Tetrapyrgos nigripes]|uniref:Glycosyltransferase family 8 protein n=1 Tax=Tetrapyrgos nigripes TaxID=182062 RepID=A0A8H5C7S9_9AGAR|nr:hypothetical protein D9758_015685 [Tetrapyrgos nigripes]
MSNQFKHCNRNAWGRTSKAPKVPPNVMSLFNTIFDLFRRHPYERLPGSGDFRSNQAAKRQGRVLLAAKILANLVVLWILAKFLSWKGPYNPFDDYQLLNTLPLLREDRRPSTHRAAIFSSLYSDSFAIGAAVLGHSIRRANVNASLVLVYLDDRVSSQALCITEAAGWDNQAVSLLPPPHNGKGIHYRFVDQYTKLRIWSLGEKLGFDSGVYLDADTMVRRNLDELFDLPWEFGATPDVYRDNSKFVITFNAGVLAFKPSTRTFEEMRAKLETASFPLAEAEQAFLNLYFGAKMVRLPYAYNANIVVKERSLKMWEELKDTMKVIHYSVIKPFWDKSIPNDKLMTPEQVRKVNDVRAGKNGGFFREEMGWWREIFEDLMQEKGAAIDACYS